MAFERPNAPVDFEYSRTAPTSATLNWGGYPGANSARPWSNVRVARFGVSPTPSLFLLTGTATTVTDTSLALDRAYTYAIRSEGASGESDWVTSPTVIYTRPDTPTNLTLGQVDRDSVRLSWDSPSTIANSWKVQGASGGGWSDIQLGPQFFNGTSVLVPSVDRTKSNTYRVIALAPDGTESNGSPTVNVGPSAVPSKPTNLTPVNGVLAGWPTTFYWNHNSSDKSWMVKYQLQWRITTNGGSTWSAWEAQPEESIFQQTLGAAIIPAGRFPAGMWLQWQVRTWGSHASPSPWSDPAITKFSDGPQAKIIMPAVNPGEQTVVSTATPLFAWQTVGQAPQARATLELVGAGADGAWPTVLEKRTIEGGGTSATFTTRLKHLGYYDVSLSVTDAQGVTTEVADSLNFAVSLEGPPLPGSVFTQWDGDKGQVEVTGIIPAPGVGQPPAVAVKVFRHIPGSGVPDSGGLPVEVAPLAGGGLSFQCVDPIPCTDFQDYSVYSVSADGGSQYRTVRATTPNTGDWVWVNYGVGFEKVARMRLSAHTSTKKSRQASRHAFSGRKFPVTYRGAVREEAISLTGLTEEGDLLGNRKAWGEVVDSEDWMADGRNEFGLSCLRDHLGRRFFGTISEVSFDNEDDDLSSLLVTLDVGDYEE